MPNADTAGARDNGDGDSADRGSWDMAASDLEDGMFYFGDPQAPTRLPVRDIDPEYCSTEDGGNQCRTYGVRHRQTFAGMDEVDLAYSHFAQDGADSPLHHDPTRWAGWDLGSGTANWRMQFLDFQSGGFLSECELDADDPCTLVDPSREGAPKCDGNFAHESLVMEETAEGRRILFTDTGNDRVITAWLPTGEVCGRVEEVMHAGTGGWDVYSGPNSLQYSATDDEQTMLLSFRDAETESEAGRAQRGGLGHGKVVQWGRVGDTWEQQWELPPESENESSFFAYPHGAARAEGPTGEPWLVLAHSLGAAATYTAQDGGSLAVYDLSSGVPTYLYDGILPAGEFFGFPRDIEPLGDGRFVVVDSGCISSTDCPVPSQGWVVRLPDVLPAAVDGAFRPDHAYQVFVEIELIEGPLLPESMLLYSMTGTLN